MTSPVSSPGRVMGLLVLVLLVASAPASGAVRYRAEVFPRVTEQRDLRYGRAPDAAGRPVALRLDLYQPARDRARLRRALVWVHGGGFVVGDKASPGDRRFVTRFAHKGYVVVSVNYRLLGGGVGIEAAQDDTQAAVRWLRANARRLRIDRRAISVAGESAGAVTALRVAYNSEDPGASGNPGRSSKVAASVSVAGAAIGTDVDRGEPPALLLHGTADTIVPYGLAESALDTIRGAGVSVRLVTYPGVGHTPLGPRFESVVTQTTRFLFRNGDGRG